MRMLTTYAAGKQPAKQTKTSEQYFDLPVETSSVTCSHLTTDEAHRETLLRGLVPVNLLFKLFLR
jgi:hypothetical protein